MSGTTVHILLATYNGARFLREQLDSIAVQVHNDWTLTISDDGSTDETLAIASDFANSAQQPVQLICSPGLGPTQNFFYLLQQVSSSASNDLFAFCDQDDVWQPMKLARAVQWHANQEVETPRLYCSRTQYVDQFLRPLGESPYLKRPASFSNALVQNIASGNTMVMNKLVLQGMRQIQPKHSVWHDWTTYLAATAMGGVVGFDDNPSVLYRQHDANVVGSNRGFSAQVRRLAPVWNGRFKQWTNTNLGAMRDLDQLVCNDAAQCISELERMRSASSILERMRLFSQSNIRRQGSLSNASLIAALMTNRI